jgi:hypothetical protein
MPVKKFRSLAHAERALWLEPGDPRIWEAARQRWALHRALGRSGVDPRRGVFKYASVQEKQRSDAPVTS